MRGYDLTFSNSNFVRIAFPLDPPSRRLRKMSKPVFNADDFASTHLKKAAVNAGGGLDPKALAAYEKVYTDCGGNYDQIKAKLGVNWQPKAIFPRTAKDFASAFLQGRLTAD